MNNFRWEPVNINEAFHSTNERRKSSPLQTEFSLLRNNSLKPDSRKIINLESVSSNKKPMYKEKIPKKALFSFKKIATKIKIKQKFLTILNRFKKAQIFSPNSNKESLSPPSPKIILGSNSHSFSFLKPSLYPITLNNVKKFFAKIRKNGYMNDTSSLKQSDLQLINDNVYCFEEEKNNNYVRNFADTLLKLIRITIDSLKKLLKINKSAAIFIIHPYSKYKILWDLFNTFLIILLFFYIPLNFCFLVDIHSQTHVSIYVALLALDIYFEFNTIYFRNGSEVRDKPKIFYHYLTHGFFIDFLSLLAIGGQLFENEISNCLSLLFYSKIMSLFRISKRLNNRFQFNHKIKAIKDLLIFIFLIVLVAHFVACFWYLIGMKSDSYFSESWISEKELWEKSWYIKYLNSFYWSLVTIMTVGYGDITPQNGFELIYSIVVILFGCMMFPYSINCIGLAIQDMNKDEIRLENSLEIINGYMNRKGINPELQTRIREYLNFIWMEEKTQNLEDEEKIINSLSVSLKQELMIDAYGLFLKNNPLFTKYFSEDSLKKVVGILEEVVIDPGDSIFRQGDQEDNPGIYFIQKGKVHIYSEQNNKDAILLKKLKKGEYFGEIPFFTNCKHEHSAFSEEFTTLLMLKQQDLIKILKENPTDYENFMMIKDKLIFSHDYSLVNKKCFSCFQPTHMIESCPKLHYIPNQEKIIKTLNYPKSQERKPFHRRKNKSFNCLFLIKKNGDISKKIIKNIFSNISSAFSDVFSEENLSNDIESDTENETEKSSEFEKKKDDKNFNEDDEKDIKKNISIDSNLEDAEEKNSETNQKHSFNKFNNYEEVSSSRIDEEEKKNSTLKEENLNDYNINREKNVEKQDAFDKGIQMQKTVGSKVKQKNITSKPNQIKCESTIVSCQNNEMAFEKVENFCNYFPNFNIEQIINNQIFLKTMEKDIHRKYLKKNYRKFKDYSFYVNEILEKFWGEKWKKNHKNEEGKSFFILNSETTKNIENKSPRNKWKPSNSILSKHHSKGSSPLKRESLNHSKIRSFGDLVKSALQKKENEKNPA